MYITSSESIRCSFPVFTFESLVDLSTHFGTSKCVCVSHLQSKATQLVCMYLYSSKASSVCPKILYPLPLTICTFYWLLIENRKIKLRLSECTRQQVWVCSCSNLLYFNLPISMQTISRKSSFGNYNIAKEFIDWCSVTADSPADCHPAAAPSGAAAAPPQPAEARPAVCASYQPSYSPRYVSNTPCCRFIYCRAQTPKQIFFSYSGWFLLVIARMLCFK